MTPKLALQHLAPQRLLSRLVYRATRWRWRPWKNFLINQMTRRYRFDLAEAAQPDRYAYANFNAFFTRALKPGARHFDESPGKLVSPADGCISQAGGIRDGRIFQAKHHDYGAAELLADTTGAAAYRDGTFVTIYLAPPDYHRVHMPLAGTLVETCHVPGRLFSVAPFTVAAIPGLFARNERLVCHFEGAEGPFVVVLVGAMLVSSVTTTWGGLATPSRVSQIRRTDYRDRPVRLAQGAELGRFNMGSTVIVLLPDGAVRLDRGLEANRRVLVGEPIGSLAGRAAIH
ncbi:MAG: archaetidylserine decarboxylase [Rhodanobacteraceae bacterium]